MSHRRAYRLLAITRNADPDLYLWLAEALADYHAGLPLEQALSLAGPRAVKIRDNALREAARLLDPKGQLSTWGLAGKLADRIGSFERSVWPRYRGTPAAESMGVNDALLQVFRAGGHVPRTQRALFEVLKNQSRAFGQAA